MYKCKHDVQPMISITMTVDNWGNLVTVIQQNTRHWVNGGGEVEFYLKRF